MQTREKLKAIYKVLDEKLAKDIKVLNIEKISSVADYFVIASGSSLRQVTALEDAVNDELAKYGENPRSVEGKVSATWILMDYGDIVVNIFEPDVRQTYNLERLWVDAKVEGMETVQA